MARSKINVVHVLLLILISYSTAQVHSMVPSLVRPQEVTNSVLFDANSADLSAKMLQKQTAPEYPQCEWIPVTVCQGLGYNMTAMPNLIGHTNLMDAEIMVNATVHFFSSFLSPFSNSITHVEKSLSPVTVIVVATFLLWRGSSEDHFTKSIGPVLKVAQITNVIYLPLKGVFDYLSPKGVSPILLRSI